VGLQDAICSDDKMHVASLVHYPIRVDYYYADRQLWIRSKRQFVESYDMIMTESLKKRRFLGNYRGVFLVMLMASC
jgi:hypothetical protein